MVSPDQSKGQTHRFHRLTSSIKGFHFYQRTPDVSKTLKSVLEETNRHRHRNRHSNQGCWDANQTAGCIPDGLFKAFASAK